ncbi:MAG: GNAT family N-acetyltransferase, partial [Deltaproteobacteria bacterium]|nr:GNAT family N-acetyltransferase [Deltaproteobacteria bacterium]
YVGTAHQRQGIGAALMDHLISSTRRPLLVGTWAAATWAVRFYERRGFTLVTPEEKDCLLDSSLAIEAGSLSIPPSSKTTMKFLTGK